MSSEPKKYSLLLVLVVLAICVVAQIKLVDGREGSGVKVTNRLNNSLETHCRSADDDIGYIYLDPSKFIQWHFKASIFGVTLFYCSFWHGEEFKRIDVYNEDLYDTCVVRNPDFSNICYWEVREDGFYFNHFEDPRLGSPWRKFYDW